MPFFYVSELKQKTDCGTNGFRFIINSIVYKTQGFSLIEILAAVAIVLVGALGFLRAVQSAKLFRVRATERLRAQLVAESITDMVASLSNQDFLTNVAQQTNNVNQFYTLNITPAFNWLREWQQAPFITDVRFRVNLTRVNVPIEINLPIRPPQVVPASAAQIATYNKEIITEVAYFRHRGAPIEVFRWRKVIPHE